MEFLKKTYWLMFTSIFTLFIFLLTSALNQLSSPGENCTEYFGSEIGSEIRSTVTEINRGLASRITLIDSIQKTLQQPGRIDKPLVRKWLENILVCENTIQRDQSRLDAILHANSHIPCESVRGDFDRPFILLNEILNLENEYWDSLIKHSLDFLSEGTNFNMYPVKFDLIRRGNRVITQVNYKNKNQNLDRIGFSETMEEVLNQNNIKLFKRIGLLFGTFGVAYIILYHLLPFGLLIWDENRNKFSGKL